MVSRTRYARAGDVHIAWAELGDGPLDLVFCSAYVSHVEHLMAHPLPAALFERLARFCRVILFDRRGSGLSDRVLSAPTLEEQMEDILTVMDAADSERAALMGFTGGGPLPLKRTSRDVFVGHIEELLTGDRHGPETDRALATVMFTDIVDSTARAAKIGDDGWTEMLDRHEHLVRARLDRWGGRAVKSLGDGFLATFDGPTSAVRCALDLADAAGAAGLPIRAGLHTGEVEWIGDDIRGIAVHIGARVSALAGAGEVLVSQTVKDLVVGSGFEMADRGEHELKGVPGTWRVHRASTGAPV